MTVTTYEEWCERAAKVAPRCCSTGAVAAVHLPTRVPAGFHGNWVPAS